MDSWRNYLFLPDSASTVSGQVDAVYLYLWALTLFFVTIVTLMLLVFSIKFRRRSVDEIPRQVAGSIKLETAVNSFVFLVFMSIFVLGAYLYFVLYRTPANAMEIHVVGKQWMWKFQHPTGNREINELHVPTGTKIKLVMTTEDVIHSLFFPAFRVKSDVVPGRYTTAWFEATKEGTYHIFCTEYCGTNHSGMGGRVIVMKPTDYQDWLSGNANQVSPVEAGRELYTNLGCATCHGANSEGGRCPPLVGLFGKQVALTGGTSVTANEEYIRESILNPAAKVVAGYPLIMPTYQGQLTEEQLLQLVTYVKSLAPQATDGIDTTAPARSNNPRGGSLTQEGQGAASPDSFRANPIGATPPGNASGTGTGATGSGSTSSGAISSPAQARPRPSDQ
jgi:cytochrome c oxidase subunit 2